MKRYLGWVIIFTMALGIGVCAYSESSGLSSIDLEPFSFQITTPEPIERQSLSSVDLDPINIEITTPEPYEIHSLSSFAGSDLQLATIEPVEIKTFDLEDHDFDSLLDSSIKPYYIGYIGSLDDSAQAQLSSLSDVEIADFLQLQYDLIADLNLAFESVGIQVNINPYTGMLAIDSSLLYATDEYKVTEQGKQVLNTVFRIYCGVLAQEKYRDRVSNVLIVGHTDNAGSYDYNVKLSERRAEAVREFCLSPECGVEDVDWLAARLLTEGHSYDELIYNADGTVNMAASRRVEIGFKLVI